MGRLLKEEAVRGLRDPWYFQQHILEVGKEDPLPRPREQIEPILRYFRKPRPVELEPEERWLRYWSSPRFTAKSVIAATDMCMRVIANPDIAIMVMGEEKGQASQVVEMVRDWLEKPKVVKLYGTFRNPRKWGKEAFTVSQRKVGDKKDPTMAASGMDVPMTGWHPDVMYWDDLLGETNNTREGNMKVKRRLKASIPVLRAGGLGFWICTRWGPSDPASDILRKWKRDGTWDAPGGRGYFGAYAKPGDEKFFPHAVAGDPLFPAIWTEKTIKTARMDMGFSLFASQVLNEPAPEEGAYWREQDFEPRFPLYQSDGSLNEMLDGAIPLMAIDPASGEDQLKYGDSTAIGVGFVKRFENVLKMFMVETVGGRWKPDQVLDAIFRLAEKWRPRQIFIETNMGRKWIMHSLEREMEARAFHLPLKEVVQPGMTKKNDRVFTLHAPYKYKQILHAQELEGEILEQQLLFWTPDSKEHDDFADMESMLWIEGTSRRYGAKRTWKVGTTLKEKIYQSTGV